MTQAELMETDVMFIQTQEILKLLDRSLFEKIPEKIKNYIVNYRSINNYSFTYDATKRLKEQDISEDTRRLIAYFDYYYWASDEDKANIEKSWELNEAKNDSNEGINGLFSNRDVVHEAVIEMQNNLPHSSITNAPQEDVQAESIEEIDQPEPMQEPVQEFAQSEPMQEPVQEFAQPEPIQEPVQEFAQTEPIQESVQEIAQPEPMQEPVQEIAQPEPMQEPVQEIAQPEPMQEPVQEFAQPEPMQEPVQEFAQPEPMQEPVQQVSQENVQSVSNDATAENVQATQTTDIAVKKEGFFARLFRKLFKRSK